MNEYTGIRLRNPTPRSPLGYGDSIRKSNLLYVVLVILWVAGSLALVLRLSVAFVETPNLIGKITLVVLAGYLEIFWYYAANHWVYFLFRHIHTYPLLNVQLPEINKPPSVALLYTTADDFVYESVLSCIEQDYSNYHVFLLDDGNSVEMRDRVDKFHEQFPDRTTVVRRETRSGFKAGNVNHALSAFGGEYEMFALCDADDMLPPDFLARTTPLFAMDERIGFVTTTHRVAAAPNRTFLEDLEDDLCIGWEHDDIVRKRYGMTLFGGHAVVVAVNAWRNAGGFPEIAGEDIPFGFALRQQGVFGYYAQDVICSESSPQDLRQWRRRHFRWVMGDTEWLAHNLLPFLREGGASFAEKCDILTFGLHRPVNGLFLPFVLLAGILPSVLPSNSSLWRWDSAIFIIAMGVSTFLIPIAHFRGQPRNLLRIICHGLTLNLSLSVLNALAVVSFMLGRRAHFWVTGDVRAGDSSEEVREETGQRANEKAGRFFTALGSLDPNGLPIVIGELVIGLALVGIALWTSSVALLGVALAVFVTQLTLGQGWDRWWARSLVRLPLVLLMAGAVLSLGHLWGAEGQWMVFAGLAVVTLR